MVWKRQAIRPPDSMILRSALSSSMGTRGVDQRSPLDKSTRTTPTTLAASEFMIIVNKTGGISQKQNWCFSQISYSHCVPSQHLRMSGIIQADSYFHNALFKSYTNLFKKQSSMSAACTALHCQSDLNDGQTVGRSHTKIGVQPRRHRTERGRKESGRK